MMASPIPMLVPESPTLSAMELPGATCPSWVETSPSAATTPNWPNPEANVMRATTTMARSDHR